MSTAGTGATSTFSEASFGVQQSASRGPTCSTSTTVSASCQARFCGLNADGASFDLADVYHRLSLSDELAGFEVLERFYEIGSHAGLMETEGLLSGGEGMSLRRTTSRGKRSKSSASSTPPRSRRMADLLAELRQAGGRLFFLGVGGSAGNCSHAVNDFRKIVGIESYAPTDNVSELTARTNDEGWATVFVEWLKVSKLLPRMPSSCFRWAAAISRRTSVQIW